MRRIAASQNQAARTRPRERPEPTSATKATRLNSDTVIAQAGVYPTAHANTHANVIGRKASCG